MVATHTALVLFSGGQDSTTCLAWALDRYATVETIGFDYGQRHHVELECRQQVFNQLHDQFPNWAAKLGPDHLINTGFLSDLGETAMTHEVKIEIASSGLPSTFVPGRNLTFLTAAAGLAYRRGISRLVGGMCETDYSGYPDCHRATIDAQEEAVSLGMDRSFTIETPLMYLDKAATWKLAHDLGGSALIELVIDHTHSCYVGDRDHKHAWGFGCGSCPACELRMNGFLQYRETA